MCLKKYIKYKINDKNLDFIKSINICGYNRSKDPNFMLLGNIIISL